MSSNDSINSTLFNVTGGGASADGGVAVRAATLVLMQCFIIPGNSLVLASIISFTKRSVADVLIGCLALIDLINGLGPVNISISMYFINLSGSNRLKDLEWLCLLYTWLSTCLRLMACFVATMMAIDRFAAILAPFFYRTRVTPRATCLCLLLVFMFCILTATLPLAISTIRTYIPLCSFDFTSPFAAFIAVLGYLQLFVVVLCYLSVICGVNAFLSRQTMIRATQIRASIAVSKSKNRENTLAETSHGVVTNRSSPLTFSRFPRHLSIDCNEHRNRSSSLSPITKAVSKSLVDKQRSRSLGQVLTKRESLSRIFAITNLNRGRSTPRAPEHAVSENPDEVVATATTTKRGSDFEVIQEVPFNTEDEEKVQMSLKQFKRNNSTWKHSRRLAIVMGIVVLLFYISWMPIVVAITVSLSTRESRQDLHFIAARMTLISAMLNFLVYGGMLKQYRNAYKSVVAKVCDCGENNGSTEDDANKRAPHRQGLERVAVKDRNRDQTTKRLKFAAGYGNKVQPIE